MAQNCTLSGVKKITETIKLFNRIRGECDHDALIEARAPLLLIEQHKAGSLRHCHRLTKSSEGYEIPGFYLWHMSNILFEAIDWSTIEKTGHSGERGVAHWQTKEYDGLRIRIV
jgi:hypothetical protein